jgi:hypothetical protein
MIGADAAQPDVSLNDDDGWTISYSRNQTVTFQNAEIGEGPWHMGNVPPDQALQFWLLLNKADLAGLKSKSWTPGKA